MPGPEPEPNMRAHSSRPVPLPRQRGSITVAVVFAILVGVVLLGAAQLAYGFYMKREMQKGADLAALSAVQALGLGAPADCAPAIAAGRASARRNIPTLIDRFTDADITVECKVWDPDRADAAGMHLFDPAGDEAFNAVRVTVSKRLSRIIPSFSGGDGGLPASVSAVAASIPLPESPQVGAAPLPQRPQRRPGLALRLAGSADAPRGHGDGCLTQRRLRHHRFA